MSGLLLKIYFQKEQVIPIYKKCSTSIFLSTTTKSKLSKRIGLTGDKIGTFFFLRLHYYKRFQNKFVVTIVCCCCFSPCGGVLLIKEQHLCNEFDEFWSIYLKFDICFKEVCKLFFLIAQKSCKNRPSNELVSIKHSAFFFMHWIWWNFKLQEVLQHAELESWNWNLEKNFVFNACDIFWH